MTTQTQRVRWKSYWAEAARSLKQALLGGAKICIAGKQYRVAYAARTAREEVDYRFLKECARGKKCVFDIGANVGMTALVMSSSIAETGRIYAFEASEACCLTIRENAILNDVAGTVEIVNGLVAEKSGLAVDFHWDMVSGRSSVVMEPPSGMSIPLSKVSLSIDDFVSNSDSQPDMAKIDVEGAEAHVIRGMQKVLQDLRPTVVVELHAWPGTSIAKNASEILTVLGECNYKIIELRTKEIVRDADAFSDIRASDSSVESRCHVLLLPKEKNLPEWFIGFDTTRL